MSGPKSVSYTVDRERQRREAERRRREAEERERNQMLASCEERRQRLEALLGKLESPCEVTVPESKGEGIAELRTWQVDLDAALKKARNELASQRERKIMEFVNRDGKRLDLSGIELSTSNVAKRVDKKGLEMEVSRAVSAIARLEDDALRDDLTTKIQGVLESGDIDIARASLLEAKTRAYEALSRQDVRALAVQEIEVISGISSPEADQIRAEALLVECDDDIRRIRNEIAALQEETLRVEEAEYVKDAITEIMSDMGYEVQGGFEVTDFGQVAYTCEDDRGYSLRIQIKPETRKIYTRVVAAREASAKQDEEAQERSCPVVHSLIDKLQDKGVSARLETECKPGDVPVERIEAARWRRRQSFNRKARQTMRRNR